MLHTQLSKPRIPLYATRLPRCTHLPSSYSLRKSHTQTQTFDYESKYAEKLHRIAKEKGLSVDELRAKAKEQRKARENEVVTQARRQKLTHSLSTSATSAVNSASTSTGKASAYNTNVRKDGSPVKPLSALLNIPRILQTPHTPAQISALWTTYHASRSNGTGRGYVCATIPVALYERMIGVASRYSSFVVPLPRVAVGTVEGEKKSYEFYFMQWGFHGSPPQPSASPEDPFTTPSLPPSGLPRTSTILFTPLGEYKLRQMFATPYIVLTHYPDLAKTHGIVLLRGEITAGGGGVEGSWMLSQEDAQMLVLGVQRFYLWNGRKEGAEVERLVKIFHEKPEEFKWEELLQHVL